MNKNEMQFGLFDNNLESFDQNIKTAVSKALETKEANEKKDSNERLSLNFITEVVENLGKLTGKDYNEIIFPKIKKEVAGILDFLGIKHVYNDDSIEEEVDSVDPVHKVRNKSLGKHSGAGKHLIETIPSSEREGPEQ